MIFLIKKSRPTALNTWNECFIHYNTLTKLKSIQKNIILVLFIYTKNKIDMGKCTESQTVESNLSTLENQST